MGVWRVTKAATPYNGSELADLDYEQTADTLYIAHIGHDPGKLTRASHTSWLHTTITFGPAIAAPGSVSATNTTPNVDAENSGDNYFPQPATYVVTAVNDETGEESRASSSDDATNDLTLKRNYNTITWASVTGATRYNIYKADNNQFYGYIGTTEDLTFRDDNIGPGLDKAPPNGEDPFADADAKPSTVALFEQRLLWARTAAAPNAIYGSRIGVNQLENMDRSRPARADDAFTMAVVSKKVNPVNSLVDTGNLIALTDHGIFKIDGDGNGGILAGNSPPSARRQIGRGASRLKPISIDTVTFYEPAVGFAVRTIGFSFEVDGLKSNDVSIFSPHFFEQFDIVDWAYTQEPRSILWAVRSDGSLLAFTWEQEQGVWGWTLCETDGLVKRVCAIKEQGEDRLYLIVERTLGGGPRRFIERMASHIWSNAEDTCFLDCAVRGAFDPPQQTFTGLWHLAGRSDVAVNADGQFILNQTVSAAGVLTLPDTVGEVSKIAIGLPYQVDVKSLPVRFEAQGVGSNLGRRQQAGDIVLQLRNTGPIKAGVDEDHLADVRMRTSEPYGAVADLLNGTTKPIATENVTSEDVEVHIRQTLPAPFELQVIGVEPVVNG